MHWVLLNIISLWVLLNIISLISKIFTVLSPIYVRAPSFSKWPPILGWMGPVGPLYCNPRLNAGHLYANARKSGKFQSGILLPHPLGIFLAAEFVPEASSGELPHQSCKWCLVKAENAIEHKYLSIR